MANGTDKDSTNHSSSTPASSGRPRQPGRRPGRRDTSRKGSVPAAGGPLHKQRLVAVCEIAEDHLRRYATACEVHEGEPDRPRYTAEVTEAAVFHLRELFFGLPAGATSAAESLDEDVVTEVRKRFTMTCHKQQVRGGTPGHEAEWYPAQRQQTLDYLKQLRQSYAAGPGTPTASAKPAPGSSE